MGCCFPRLMSPENVIRKDDGHLMLRFPTGGMTLIRGNIQQNLPSGTLFVTDKKLIHCTKFFGYHRLEFRLSKLKELDSSLSFGSNCQVTIPCCTSMPDSYLVFKAKLNGKLHCIGVKIKDSDEAFHRVEKIVKRFKIRLSIIEEERDRDSTMKTKLDSSNSDHDSTIKQKLDSSCSSDRESMIKTKPESPNSEHMVT